MGGSERQEFVQSLMEKKLKFKIVEDNSWRGSSSEGYSGFIHLPESLDINSGQTRKSQVEAKFRKFRKSPELLVPETQSGKTFNELKNQRETQFYY